MDDAVRYADLPFRQMSMSSSRPATLLAVADGDLPGLADLRMRALADVMARHGGTEGTSRDVDDAMAMATSDPAWVARFADVDRGLIAFVGPRPLMLPLVRRILDDVRSTTSEERGFAYVSPYTRHAVYATVSAVFDRRDDQERTRIRELTRRSYEDVVRSGAYPEPYQGAVSRIMATARSTEHRRAPGCDQVRRRPGHAAER